MNKLHRYLLTHHPLLWNTRIVPVLAANLLIHLLFFLGGYGSITAENLHLFSDVYDPGGGNMIGFAILCSLLVLIVWLVFFLRNNAFKLHYRIGGAHLAGEFLLILLILGTSSTYFLSHAAGVRVHAKAITGAAAFEAEEHAVNCAIAFVPTSISSYHISENCLARRNREREMDGQIITATAPGLSDTEIRKWPGEQFSYLNYCALPVYAYDKPETEERERLNALRNRWLREGRRDSVRRTLLELDEICSKYGVERKWNIDSLANWAFATPDHQVRHLVGAVRPNNYTYEEDTIRRDGYIVTEELYDALRFIRKVHEPQEAYWGMRLAIAYVVLSLSIVLLAYRRFSRKVFLISIVGALVWSIIIGLLVAASGGESTAFAGFCLFLVVLFLLLGIMGLRTRSGKTMTGTALTWHAWLAPFVAMFIWMFFDEAYNSYFRYGTTMSSERMRAEHPLLFWVHENPQLIFGVNLLIALVYIATVFNRLAKRWMEMPEE